MSADPDLTPNADGRYPRLCASIQPDLGESHPRTEDQLRALEAIAGARNDLHDPGLKVETLALVSCRPALHAGHHELVGAVWLIGGEPVYAASVPRRHVTVPLLADRRADFEPVEQDQWVWPLRATEGDVLRAYCRRHADVPLWVDRVALLGVVRQLPARHAQRLYVNIEQVARIV